MFNTGSNDSEARRLPGAAAPSTPPPSHNHAFHDGYSACAAAVDRRGAGRRPLALRNIIMLRQLYVQMPRKSR